MCYQIVLADDYPIFRQCVRKILADTSDLEIVGEADDGQALLEMLFEGSITPDLIITDISMPRLDGIGAIQCITALLPHIKTLVLTAHEEEDCIAMALNSGAAGYLLKVDAFTELIAAIGQIRQGANYLSSCLEPKIN
jgi:DNA-binding NarL/FixJ family response regulator